jgi:hypothetical protein
MSDLVVESCDPRDQEAGLKDLFFRSGKAEFAGVFDTVYRPRADRGLRSWIGLSGQQVVMHISVTPMRFLGSGRVLRGGVLGDLMVDDEHRDFWGPVRMLRKMLGDLKRSGQPDFLITSTTAEAEPLFKAGGFRPFGTLRRYSLPLHRAYLGVTRWKSGAGLRAARPRVLPECDYAALASMSDGAGYWRPEPVASFYDTRIPRMESVEGTWLGVPGKEHDEAGIALLARDGTTPQLLAFADAFWSDGDARLRRVTHSAAGWARAQRFSKLVLTTIAESRATRQLERTGFLGREVRSSLLVNQLTPEAPPPVEDWFLTGFALSGW